MIDVRQSGADPSGERDSSEAISAKSRRAGSHWAISTSKELSSGKSIPTI